jgi:formylglycine-generating enzyme required for sulfatase activity
MALRSVDPERGTVIVHKKTRQPLTEVRVNDRGSIVLAGADLREADLSGTDLGGAIMSRAWLTDALMTGVRLEKAHLVEASLERADLSRASLVGADLRWANLQSANLREARLEGALLGGADLRGADLTGAVIDEAGLLEVESDETTIWPHGQRDPDWQRKLQQTHLPQEDSAADARLTEDDAPTMRADDSLLLNDLAGDDGPVEIQVLEFDEGLDVLSLESDSQIYQGDDLLDRWDDVVMHNPASLAEQTMSAKVGDVPAPSEEDRREALPVPDQEATVIVDRPIEGIDKPAKPEPPEHPVALFLSLIAQAGFEQGAFSEDEVPLPLRTNSLIATAVATDWQLIEDDISRRETIQQLAQAKSTDVRGWIEEAIGGLDGPIGAQARRRVETFLRQVPEMIRQSLRRPADNRGLTVPSWFTAHRPLDLLPFLPGGRPMFHRGDRPLPQVDLELRELLGVGGFGEVWRAENPHLPGLGSVALKFFRATEQDARKQLLHEARVVDRILQTHPAHPGLVAVQNTFLSAEHPCLQLEYVPGCNLAGLIRHQWQDYRAKAYEIIACIASIVGLGHRLLSPVIHRDLKPSNILMTKTRTGYQFKVADFGIGAWAARQTLEQHRASPGSTTGTRMNLRGTHSPGYASPQQMEGAEPDPRDDVYALGVIWYQLLTGDLTAVAPTGYQWLRELKRQGHTDRQIMIIASCLENDPSHRAPDAGKLAELIIKEFMIEMPASPPPQKRTGPSPSKIQAKPVELPLPPTAWGDETTASAGPKLTEGGVENSLGMQFANIPAGEFVMGSDPKEAGHEPLEGPRHPVRITTAFLLGNLPVTWGQFRAVMTAGVRVQNHFERFDELPAEGVSWEDAEEFCRRLSDREDERAAGRRYRLPTEAEWEYACRAGSTTPFAHGSNLSGEDANFLCDVPYGDADPMPPAGSTLPWKASDAPNLWGLYHMHGNVWEWVADRFVNYTDSPAEDPYHEPIPGEATEHVARGGDANSPGHRCRSAARLVIPARRSAGGTLTLPDRNDGQIIGFRVVCEVEE